MPHETHDGRGDQRRGRRDEPRHGDEVNRQRARDQEAEHQRRNSRDQEVQERTVGTEHAGPVARQELHQHPRGGVPRVAGVAHGKQHDECAADVDDPADQQRAGTQAARR